MHFCFKIKIWFVYENIQQVTTRIVSLVGKTSISKCTLLTTPKVGPQKPVLVLLFIFALILDVKIAWLGCQVAAIIILKKWDLLDTTNLKSVTITIYFAWTFGCFEDEQRPVLVSGLKTKGMICSKIYKLELSTIFFYVGKMEHVLQLKRKHICIYNKQNMLKSNHSY